MQITRHVPHFRSFKLVLITLFAFFVIANFSNVTTQAFAPAPPPTQGADFIPVDIPTSGDAGLDEMIYQAGAEYGVDPRLVHAVIFQESGYRADAKSGAGARGLMQMIPSTAHRFAVKDTTGAEANVAAGTKCLRWLLERFEGNVELALAAYNAGEGAVDKYDGVPPYKQTQHYVRTIVARYGKNYHPVLAPADARLAFQLAQR